MLTTPSGQGMLLILAASAVLSTGCGDPKVESEEPGPVAATTSITTTPSTAPPTTRDH